MFIHALELIEWEAMRSPRPLRILTYGQPAWLGWGLINFPRRAPPLFY